ncbi:hypothetical protein [Bacillus sp. FJAT-45037]|uniref:hypothetical protein n=1 Tax=Bacillus sp. FJAT-45037 TaxID=2011007 RepID=UPI000C24D3E4|nr:hypothetical protein [Bacillus sp. FJAT-45037]
MKKSIIIWLVLGLLLVGCNEVATISLEDMEKVEMELINAEEEEDGIHYQIQLTNDSDHVIEYYNMYVGYSIKLEDGRKESPYKIEVTPNELSIQPGEEVLLTVFAPYEGLAGEDTLDFNQLEVKLVGYFNEVSGETMFSMGRSFLLNE